MDEKYKELYDLSFKVLEEEQQRTTRLDAKASQYFSVLSFLIGIYGIFGSRILTDCIPFKSWLDIVLVGLGVIVLLGLMTAWLLCFTVFRQHVLVKVPLNEEMLKFFNDNELIDIYYTLSKANKDALAENRKVTNKKSYLLTLTYKTLFGVFIFMIAMFFVFGINVWSKKNNFKNGGIKMVEENRSKGKPKEDIKPPTYDRITEGYDPSKTKKIEKGVIKKDKEKK